MRDGQNHNVRCRSGGFNWTFDFDVSESLVAHRERMSDARQFTKCGLLDLATNTPAQGIRLWEAFRRQVVILQRGEEQVTLLASQSKTCYSDTHLGRTRGLVKPSKISDAKVLS